MGPDINCQATVFWGFFFGHCFMRDLSSQTKARTWAVAMKAPNPNH